MAQHMQESGVAPCLINVSVKKEALPRGFFSCTSRFLSFLFPYHPVLSGTLLRDFSCISELLRTIEIRQWESFHCRFFLSSLGILLASPPHVSKNREPKTTLSHSKLALPQSTSHVPHPTHIQGSIAAQSSGKGCRLLAKPISDDPCIWGLLSCIFHASFQLWYSIYAGAPSCITEGRDWKWWVVKIWCSNWFGSCLLGLRSPCVSSLAGCVSWAAVVHSGPRYTFRRMFLECLTEHNWPVCWLASFP